MTSSSAQIIVTVLQPAFDPDGNAVGPREDR
jgi:hypothetical protein